MPATSIPFPKLRIEGMYDVHGLYQRYFTFIKKVARHEFRKNGFTRISLPLLEKKDIFMHGLGQRNNIPEERLYYVENNDYIIRPEGTVGCVRAHIDNFLQEPQPSNIYYIEPFFQNIHIKGERLRQFYQVGAEVIGEEDPVIDATLIFLASSILDTLGLSGEYSIQINSLGNEKEKTKYCEELKNFFANKKHHFNEEEVKQIEENPLALFYSENEDMQELLKAAPKSEEFLKKDSKSFYSQMCEYLDMLGINYTKSSGVTRKGHFYTKSIWEFRDEAGRLLISGGRHDSIGKSFGYKKPLPGAGWAAGMDMIANHIHRKGIMIKDKDTIHLYLIQLGDEAKKIMLPFSIEARRRGLRVRLSIGTSSLRLQMQKAQRLKAQYAAVVGIMEARKGVCQFRNLEDGTQQEMKISDLIEKVIHLIGEKNLDFYNPVNDFSFEEIKQEPLEENFEINK